MYVLYEPYNLNFTLETMEESAGAGGHGAFTVEAVLCGASGGWENGRF
jgi:hypothetical protein